MFGFIVYYFLFVIFSLSLADEKSCSFYGAVITAKAVLSTHSVHLTNADPVAPGGRRPSDQATRLGL